MRQHGSGEDGRSASGKRDGGARAHREPNDVKGDGAAGERLGDELPGGHMARVAEQMTGDAVIAGMEIRPGRCTGERVLRLVVDQNRRIAILIVPGAVQRRGKRQPGGQDDQRMRHCAPPSRLWCGGCHRLSKLSVRRGAGQGGR